MKVNLSHIEPVSTCDYFGRAACVIFLNGCNMRCQFCFNKQTWAGKRMVDIEVVKHAIRDSEKYVGAVVISGGEPFLQPEATEEIAKYAKLLGIAVAIETNGYFTQDMIDLHNHIDRYCVSVKAPIYDRLKYKEITGIDSSDTIRKTLECDLMIEIQIVDDPDVNINYIIESVKGYGHPIRILPLRKYV